MHSDPKLTLVVVFWICVITIGFFALYISAKDNKKSLTLSTEDKEELVKLIYISLYRKLKMKDWNIFLEKAGIGIDEISELNQDVSNKIMHYND